MDTGLAGKRVLVTGGAGGIGSACVRAFAAEGADVVVHYNTSRERAEELAAEVGGVAVQADLTDEAQVDALFARGGRSRRVRRGRGLLAARRRAGVAAPARALAGDARREPHRDVPHRARLPPLRRAHRPRQSRPRRLDRGALRRGRPRRLRRGEGGAPGRAAPLASRTRSSGSRRAAASTPSRRAGRTRR